MSGQRADDIPVSRLPAPPPPPRAVKPPRRRWVRWGLTGVCVLFSAAVFILVTSPPYGWFEHPWRVKVTSVQGDQVCTTVDHGERDPGWRDPLCFDHGLETEAGEPVSVSVGQCVQLHSCHPLIFADHIVPCASR